jgi:predicted anti-sigma-YlaC factor YlaD
MELTGGKHAGPYVTLAEAVALAERNRPEFERLLRQALTVDSSGRPDWRLVNSVMQRRARWLLARTDKLFAD